MASRNELLRGQEGFDSSDHSQQSHSNQHQPSCSRRETKKDQKVKRMNAIKEVERDFINVTVHYILGETDDLNLPDERGCGLFLKKDEQLNRYLGRISTMVYQKVYNKVMNQSQVGSSYSFNKRTSGNALDSNGIVFMKDLDVDHVTKQAISIAFRKQLMQRQQKGGRTAPTSSSPA